MTELRTARLLLRQWRREDEEPFAALSADPAVMQFMPACLSRAESDAFVRRARENLERHGFGLWALQAQEPARLIGYVGLAAPAFQAAFTPCIEIGWRLQRANWGHGYATEAAAECLRFGFQELGLHEVVSFTVPANTPSRALMQRLGMRRDRRGDFEHPRLPKGHALRHHVLYRLSSGAWAAASGGVSGRDAPSEPA